MTIDEQLEYSLLGGLLLGGWSFPKDTLKKEDFKNKTNYELYELLYEFWEKERELINIEDPLDIKAKSLMFASWLDSKDLLRKYSKSFVRIQENVVPPSVVPSIVERIKKRTASKELLNLALELTKKKDIEETIEIIEEKLRNIKKETLKESLRKVNISEFINNKPPKIDFVFNSLPVSSIGVLASPGGLGKSMFVLTILTAIATGKDITEGTINTHGKTGKCLYINLEDPELILHYRIWNLMEFLNLEERKKFQENLSIYTQKEIFELVDAQGVINQKNMDELKKIVEGQKLVVIDTLRRVHSADENSAGQMSVLLQVFEVIAKETGTAFLLIHHTGKAYGKNSRGSSVLYDNVRYQINLEPVSPKDAQQLGVSNHKKLVRLVNTKSNYGPLEPDQMLYRIDHGVLRLYDAVIAADY